MSIEAFSEDLQLLIDGLNSLDQLDDGDLDEGKKKLRKLYRSLHQRMSSYNLSSLRKLPAEQQLIVRHLELGKDAFDRFHSKILPLIQPKAKDTSIAIAKFNTSSEAFALINSKQVSLDPQETAEAKRLLGGILGVSVGNDFIVAVKGEMMGRVIAYALAGLCEQDLADYAAMGHKKGGAARDKFLLGRIVARDSELVYRTTPPAKGSNQWGVACAIDEGRAVEVGATRKKMRADTCMVNHASRKIVFGSITSNASSDKKQTLSLTKTIAALELLVQQPHVGGDPNKPNPYYGYDIEPFYFHTGNIPVDAVHKGRMGAGAALFQLLASGGGTIKKSEHRAIAKLAFFSLLGETNPNAASARALALLNVHICGCDTLDLYRKMRKARSKGAGPRDFAAICLGAVSEALDVFSREDTNVSMTGRGQNLLRPALESLVKICDQYFVNFPVSKWGEVGVEEKETLLSIGKKMKALANKIGADRSGLGNDLIMPLLKLSGALGSVAGIRAQAEAWGALEQMQFKWNEGKHQVLAEQMGLGLQQGQGSSREAVIDAILSDLSAKRVPGVMEQVIQIGLSAPGKLSLRGWAQELADQATRTAGGGHSVVKLKSNSTQNHFSQNFSHILTGSDQGHPGVIMAHSLRPFFRKDVWGARASIQQNPEARQAVGDFLDKILELDPLTPGVDKLMSDLAAMAHPAIAAAPKGRKKNP